MAIYEERDVIEMITRSRTINHDHDLVVPVDDRGGDDDDTPFSAIVISIGSI